MIFHRQHYICVKQHDTTDCGPACLATVAKQYGLDLSLAKIRSIAGTDRQGTNMFSLLRTAEKLGFEATGVKGDKEAFLAGFPVPAIAHVIVDGNLLHYIVIEEVTSEKKIIVSDPAKGIVVYKPDDFFSIWTGALLLLHPGETFTSGTFSVSPIHFLFRLIKEQRKILFPICLLSLFVTGSGITGAFYYQYLIDIAAQSNTLQKLNTFTIGIIFLYILMQVLSFARGQLIIHLSNRLDTALVFKSYIHATNLPMDFFEYRKTGEIISRFTDAAQARDAISQGAITILIDVVMALAGGIMLYVENPLLLEIACVLLILYAVIAFSFARPLKKHNEKIMNDNAFFNAHIIESINGEETIKTLQAESDFEEKGMHLFQNLLSSVLRGNTISNIQATMTGAAAFIGEILILWAGTVMTIAGSMTMGKLMTFVALLTYFLTPIQNVINFQPQLQTALVSIERLLDILELNCESSDETDTATISGENIVLSHVNFRYGSRQLVLHDINLRIQAGEKLAIVGESGCGKTTLVKLLLRLFDFENGDILIGGRNIQSFSPQFLRKQIAYVSQNIVLFSGSIRENLEMGIGKLPEDELDRVCELCSIKSYIDSLPFRYDTSVGENGDSMSGGQKQRLAIARALLRHPSVLILDEATSHLDSITETAIQKMLSELPASMTVIMIAHRLSTIKNSDRIVVMDHGSIAELGSHEKLLEHHGIYWNMWNRSMLMSASNQDCSIDQNNGKATHIQMQEE